MVQPDFSFLLMMIMIASELTHWRYIYAEYAVLRQPGQQQAVVTHSIDATNTCRPQPAVAIDTMAPRLLVEKEGVGRKQRESQHRKIQRSTVRYSANSLSSCISSVINQLCGALQLLC